MLRHAHGGKAAADLLRLWPPRPVCQRPEIGLDALHSEARQHVPVHVVVKERVLLADRRRHAQRTAHAAAADPQREPDLNGRRAALVGPAVDAPCVVGDANLGAFTAAIGSGVGWGAAEVALPRAWHSWQAIARRGVASLQLHAARVRMALLPLGSRREQH